MATQPYCSPSAPASLWEPGEPAQDGRGVICPVWLWPQPSVTVSGQTGSRHSLCPFVLQTSLLPLPFRAVSLREVLEPAH